MSVPQPKQQKLGMDQLWIQHQRRNAKSTRSWACTLCLERRIFTSSETLWQHAIQDHREHLPNDDLDVRRYRTKFEAECLEKCTTKTPVEPRRPTTIEEPPPQPKRPLSSPAVGGGASLVDMQELNIRSPGVSEDVTMKDVSDENSQQPRKRHAFGEGISAGGSIHDSSASPSPVDTKGGRPSSAPGPNVTQNTPSPAILGRSSQGGLQGPTREEFLDIMLQPETRPISQEQLVAEVKGIYAGLVMVEAKCIEVDNKQATLAQADTGNPPKLNNEQWQALIALHRTLLHEHHDFFLASQHPSASPALRRLASKYAMPARMWRHGIHSFLELLRHRLPASLDHMLAFIYLAYSMMALLYETVSAFKDTWVECLGDLARYRMAIEDDDIRDREVWTGVARHWYSIASDNSPTTGRLYHHLAILARPNALQQLFFYSKSLCVAIPFTSARESILTLFEPVLNSDNGQGQYRLPPLDTAFVKAHGLLFTNKDLHKFDPAVDEFLGLLDTQIGRVTRKFMEQGYHIAVANCVAMVGFAAKENVLMKIISPVDEDVAMANTSETMAQSMAAFKSAERLSNATTEIILERVGDPNVLPFIHVTLIFMLFVARHPAAMDLLAPKFPWKSLAIMLNTILGAYQTPGRIEDASFPVLEQDDPRPFPEDFAVRGLLWTEGYFTDDFFTKKKIDEEEKYHERASMTSQRKERILWLACRIADLVPHLTYNGKRFSIPSSSGEEIELPTRTSTFASVATSGSFDRVGTWESQDGIRSEGEDEEEVSSPATVHAAELMANE
ncbi:hypothetical protein HYFRA_00011627 [Hymenoscyphus fraxineus]|uniref:DNA/RNA-binding domain-containing protein n=1 Tax=Hymenoscyphus fraxineus TaxID=746836 RepID=A0A9N9PU12_9HELO|nr:hypothetical protein HYFRA_00011627 [Hymenoscyphus fraxineus]